jgi:mannose-1-phosphate guanylyltransferase
MRNGTENGTAFGTTAGIILAAGHGTRMRPLTDTIPKPLLPVLGVPLLEIIIHRLLGAGAGTIHANLYHLADRIAEYAGERDWPVTFHREPELLGTGGGIGNIAQHLPPCDLILLQNGDILSNIDFGAAISRHRNSDALVTMIVIPAGTGSAGNDNEAEGFRRPPPSIHVNDGGFVTTVGASPESADDPAVLGYTGMAVLSTAALEYFPRGEPGGLVETIHSIIAKRPGAVAAYNPSTRGNEIHWGEIGSCGGYLDLHRRILVEKTLFDPSLPPPPLPLHVGKGSTIDPGADWRGFLAVGSNATIERDVTLEDCVVLDGTFVAAGNSHRSAVLFPEGTIEAA